MVGAIEDATVAARVADDNAAALVVGNMLEEKVESIDAVGVAEATEVESDCEVVRRSPSFSPCQPGRSDSCPPVVADDLKELIEKPLLEEY